MLLIINPPARPPRLTVLAYDMACERRARQVRRVLTSVHQAKQYSVFEAVLREGEFRGLLAEITAFCDLSEDLLAVWWPRDGVRLYWNDGSVLANACGSQQGRRVDTATAMEGTSNFVVCYDISDPEALNAVAGEVAAEGAMVQRSVYWLRVPPHRLSAVLARSAQHLGGGDRLWAYPLRRAGDLWRVGPARTSILPIATHRWVREEQ